MKKVSVIIPCYNHDLFIEECILSVLAQDYSDVELIVVDDGSKDSSPDLLKKLSEQHGFKLVLKENQGVCATLNKGLSLASGDFITFLASDDYMPSTRISEQVAAIESMPEVDVVAAGVKIVDEESRIIGEKSPRGIGLVTFDQLIRRNMVFAPTAIFRKEVFLTYGLYPENYLFEDYYMWLRIVKAGGKIFNTDKNWAFYRINRSNLEKRFNWYYKGYIQTLNDYLPDIRVTNALDHYRLIFCTKMTFLNGWNFINRDVESFHLLGLHYKITLKIIASLPELIRRKILMFLLKEV
jgi:alpha-1,3-rhamnosyltransferase